MDPTVQRKADWLITVLACLYLGGFAMYYFLGGFNLKYSPLSFGKVIDGKVTASV